jgi:adenine-specific DNA-methyltransferase
MIELNRIHNMPCQEMFTGLAEQAALIVADPPYGIKYNSSMKVSMVIGRAHSDGKRLNTEPKPRYDLERFDDADIDTSWLAPAYASLKDGGAMYLFTRWDVLHQWHAAAQGAGFKVVQRIVWNKDMLSMGDLRYYGSMTEDVLFCIKGTHKLNCQIREGNIWRFPRGGMMAKDLPKQGGWRHPTQKPVDLFKKIITYSSDHNDLILDPFTGSGAACIAAQRLHRRFIGCDISPTFASAAQAWIEDDARTNAQVRMKPMFEAQS